MKPMLDLAKLTRLSLAVERVLCVDFRSFMGPSSMPCRDYLHYIQATNYDTTA